MAPSCMCRIVRAADHVTCHRGASHRVLRPHWVFLRFSNDKPLTASLSMCKQTCWIKSHLFHILTGLNAKTTTCLILQSSEGSVAAGESHSTMACIQSALPADRLMSCNQPCRSDSSVLWQWLVSYGWGIVNHLLLNMRMLSFVVHFKTLTKSLEIYCERRSMWTGTRRLVSGRPGWLSLRYIHCHGSVLHCFQQKVVDSRVLQFKTYKLLTCLTNKAFHQLPDITDSLKSWNTVSLDCYGPPHDGL